MFEVVCINGNYHVNGVDGNSRFISTDKNALIKELAARIGVSILTSDEVDLEKNSGKMLKDKPKEPVDDDVKVEIDIALANYLVYLIENNLRSNFSETKFKLAIDRAKRRMIKKHPESTDWDTEPISHDGIQFNKHFIELKLKVAGLETEIVKLKNK